MSALYGEAAIQTAANPASWELWPAPERYPEVLYQRFPEFTCLCPRSSYPDFATVHLVLVPNRQVVELKHLKLWFNSFRDRPISHEQATAHIVETLESVIDPHYVFVLLEYTPRGNLTTFPMVEFLHSRVRALPAEAPVHLAIDNATHVKRLLIGRVLSAWAPCL